MNVQNKKVKRKEDIKNLILNAAKKLFVEEGYRETSIRRIASEIGISPTTIYLYYKDKSDIAYALHQEGFTLMKTLFSSLITVESPFERLKAIGKTYLLFAMENPDFYEIMFMMKEPMEFLDSKEDERTWEEGKEVFNFLVYTVEECRQQGYFPGSDVNYVALQAWTAVHGLCSLYVNTHLQKVGEECLSNPNAESLVDVAFKVYVGFLEGTKLNNK